MKPSFALPALLSLVLVLGACGTRSLTQAQQLGIYAVPTVEQEIVAPPVGTQSTASVGGPVVSHSRERRPEVLAISTRLDINQQHGDEDNYTISIPAGIFKITNKDLQGNAYFSVGKLKMSWYERGKFNQEDDVLVDYKTSPDGKLSVIWAYVGDNSFEEVKIPPIEFQKRYGDAESSTSSFRRELLYTGRSGSTLTLLYREFANDMARPAFSQQLQYDINGDSTIGYEGARLRVLSADNTKIVYDMLSPLSRK